MKTPFFHLHPSGSFLFFLLQFLVVLTVNHPVILGVALLTGFALDFALKKKKAIKLLFALYLPLTVFCAVFNGLFSHYGVTVLFVLPSGNNCTLEPVIYGLVFGVKLVVMLMIFSSFNEIITSEKFIYLFGRISPKTALVISMALRFIPLFSVQSKEIEEARQTLGINTKQGNIFVRIKSAVSNLSILITWVLERGIDTANSMSARGYGSGKRSRYSQYRFSNTDIILFVCELVFAVIFAFTFTAIKCSFNPIIKISELSFQSVIISVSLLLYGMFPLLYNFSEKRRWKS